MHSKVPHCESSEYQGQIFVYSFPNSVKKKKSFHTKKQETEEYQTTQQYSTLEAKGNGTLHQNFEEKLPTQN